MSDEESNLSYKYKVCTEKGKKKCARASPQINVPIKYWIGFMSDEESNLSYKYKVCTEKKKKEKMWRRVSCTSGIREVHPLKQ
jgi:hypothetical protein